MKPVVECILLLLLLLLLFFEHLPKYNLFRDALYWKCTCMSQTGEFDHIHMWICAINCYYYYYQYYCTASKLNISYVLSITCIFCVGSGIPEMKVILRGTVLSRYLSMHTLIAKIVSSFYHSIYTGIRAWVLRNC